MLKISTLAAIITLTGTAHADGRKPPELAALAKAMAGTWKCKGQGFDASHAKLVDMTATARWSVAVGGSWVHEAFDGVVAGVHHYYDAYTSFDVGARKWRRVMVQGGGGWSTGEATSATAAKLDWEMSVHSANGDFPFRDHVDATDPARGIKGWGELSMDGGKTWIKAYDLTCRR